MIQLGSLDPKPVQQDDGQNICHNGQQIKGQRRVNAVEDLAVVAEFCNQDNGDQRVSTANHGRNGEHGEQCQNASIEHKEQPPPFSIRGNRGIGAVHEIAEKQCFHGDIAEFNEGVQIICSLKRTEMPA